MSRRRGLLADCRGASVRTGKLRVTRGRGQNGDYRGADYRQRLEDRVRCSPHTATAAAGDVVSATVTKGVLARGTRVRGRILNLERWMDDRKWGSHFLIAISFDVAEMNGVAVPLHLRLDHPLAENKRWSEDTLPFLTKQERYVVPAGFESKWVTTK